MHETIFRDAHNQSPKCDCRFYREPRSLTTTCTVPCALEAMAFVCAGGLVEDVSAIAQWVRLTSAFAFHVRLRLHFARQGRSEKRIGHVLFAAWKACWPGVEAAGARRCRVFNWHVCVWVSTGEGASMRACVCTHIGSATFVSLAKLRLNHQASMQSACGGSFQPATLSPAHKFGVRTSHTQNPTESLMEGAQLKL